MTADNAIEIRGLNKTYAGTRKSPPKTALYNVDLDIPRGSIFGLLGQNGAGKSTIINIMAGLVIKSAGKVKIWDSDLDKAPRQARAAIGVVPQEINYDPFFTPRELLDLQAGMYAVPKKERRSDELLALVGLSDQAGAYTRTLSGGMRRRLLVAKAMVHSPPILVLDEPTAGVDVELRRQLWDNVRALNDQGVTILLTTHYLKEAEELCDEIAIIHHGQVLVSEEKEKLVGRIDSKEIRFRLDRPFQDIPAGLEQYAPVKEGRRTLMVRYSPEETPAGKIIEAVQAGGFGIADISTQESDLEDVFLQLTQENA